MKKKLFIAIFIFLCFMFLSNKDSYFIDEKPIITKRHLEAIGNELYREFKRKNKRYLNIKKLSFNFKYKFDGWGNYLIIDTQENVVFSCGEDGNPYTDDDIKHTWNSR